MIWYFLIRFWYDSPCSSCLSGCPFRWIQTVISLIWTGFISQHCFATHQRVGGKDGRRLGVPRTEHTRCVDGPRAHWFLYPGTNFKTRNGQNPSDSWLLLRILLNQASTYSIWCTSAREQLFHGSVQTGMLLPMRFKIIPSDYLT